MGWRKYEAVLMAEQTPAGPSSLSAASAVLLAAYSMTTRRWGPNLSNFEMSCGGRCQIKDKIYRIG